MLQVLVIQTARLPMASFFAMTNPSVWMHIWSAMPTGSVMTGQTRVTFAERFHAQAHLVPTTNTA